MPTGKTIKGKSRRDYWNDLRKKSKPLRRTRAKAKKTHGKKRGTKEKIPGLFEFFLEMIEKCKWVCEECGKECPATNLKFQLAAQAHILEKKTFRSVAKVPENILCLPKYGCGHHGAFDASWERRMRMNVWPEVEKRLMEVLIPMLPPNEYVKLPDFLRVMYEKRAKELASGEK